MFLLVATTGITFSMHYCGGKLVSTSIFKEAKSCCGGMGCCKNKIIHYEVKDDYVSPILVEHQKIDSFDVLFPVLIILNYDLLSVEEFKWTIAFYDSSSPPPSIQTKLAFLQTYLC